MSTDIFVALNDTPVVRNLLSNLGFGLCKGRELPAEIAALISEHFVERDILIISTLSQELNELANAVLYHHLVIEPWRSPKSKRSAILLLRSLITNRTAASDVRHISLRSHISGQWASQTTHGHETGDQNLISQAVKELNSNLALFKPQEVELYKSRASFVRAVDRFSTAWLTLPWLCFSIITLAPSLEHFWMDSEYFKYSDFQIALRRFSESGGFRSLKSSDFCADFTQGRRSKLYASSHWDNGLLVPFFAPNIDSITTLLSLSPSYTTQLRTSTVTRLSLTHYQEQPLALEKLLAATPKLGYLQYNAWVDYVWIQDLSSHDERSDYGLEPLFEALHHVKNTLTELVTTVDFAEDIAGFRRIRYPVRKSQFRKSKGLSQLEHLRILSVPWTHLLGGTQKDEPVEDWDMILPKSLREITWTDHLNGNFSGDDWTDKGLIPVITSLLSWLQQVKGTHETSKFGILLNDSPAQFSEPIFQTLFQLCQRHDVSFSIQKTDPDPFLPRARGPGGRRLVAMCS